MYVTDSSGITFDNCTFSNFANVDTGSVAFVTGSQVTFENSDFTNNHANIAALSVVSASQVPSRSLSVIGDFDISKYD